MSLQPIVSLIVPVYNVEAYLPDCVESLLAQAYAQTEIILVDDGSTDSSGHICDIYAKRFGCIIVIHKTNQGVNYARRDGFEKSKGEYVAFVDADDIIGPNFITNNLKLLRETTADLTVCKTHSFYGKYLSQREIDQCRVGGTSPDYSVLKDKRTILSSFMTSLPPYRNMAIMCVWGKLYKRAIIKKVNWEIANYSHSEDYFISAQTFDAAGSVCFINEYNYFYRRNRTEKITQNAQHNTAPDGRKIDNLTHIRRLARLYNRIANKNNIDLAKEIVIFQCRLYTYWLDKSIDRRELDRKIWYRTIIRYLFPLIPVMEAANFRNHMYENLFYGSELYEALCKKLKPLRENPTTEQYLQHKIYSTKDIYSRPQIDIDYTNAWVIMDRPESVTDNGYYFYKWIKNNHPEINLFFVINWDSKDVPMLRSEGFNLVYTNTEQHRQLLDNCSVEVYAFYTFNLCPSRTSFNSLKVYLGHGVSMGNSLNPGLSANDLFVTTFKPEFNFYSKSRSDFKTILTGMPRFESLTAGKSRAKDKIVIAPTWRRWLRKQVDQNADYFVQWSSFAKSKDLKGLSQNYEVIFIVRPELERVVDLFKVPKYISMYKYGELGAKNLQNIMMESKLMITDFSSIAFDFAIAGAEIVYFQFDKDKFYNNHSSKKGWYDYDNDGLGPVFSLRKEVLKYINIKINGKDIIIENIYKQRLANLVSDSSMLLEHPSKNIFYQIIKELHKTAKG